MPLVKLIDPEGNEVLTSEGDGVAALKEKGYKDAPKPKASAKKDESESSE